MIHLVVALVFLAVLLLSVAVGLLVVTLPSGLDSRLAGYRLGGGRATPVGEGGRGRRAMARTEVVKAVVRGAEELARRHGVLQWLERRLEQADVHLRAAEILFFIAAAVALAGAGAFVLAPLPLALAVPVSAAVIPMLLLVAAGGRRRRRFAAQLPDALVLLAGTLRSGYSLHQGLDAVSKEVQEPMAAETRRVLAEARLGRDLEDALGDCAARMDSGDLRWTVLALAIQRDVGGNLAELLDTVADTMVQRERLRREVSALTAEGRMSAIVLGALPPGLGAVLSLLNPGYVGRLFDDLVGQTLVVTSAIVAILGFAWMKKIIDIEV